MLKKEIIVAIDGNSLINRAFYALPPLQNSKGQYSNAIYGFITMLLKAINDICPKYIVVAFDLKEPTFRHKKYDFYKATRKPMPSELAAQIPELKRLLGYMNIKYASSIGFEADDILGAASKKYGIETIIITGDRDALQLIDDKTSVWLTKRGISEIADMNPQTMSLQLGLTPKQVIDFKALCGDSSDNIPGVRGIGQKTALALLQKYQTLDNIYADIDNISGSLKQKLLEDKQSAYQSYELATIDCNAPLDFLLDDLQYDFPFSAKVRDAFAEFEFKSLLKRTDLFFEAPQAPKAQPVSTVQSIVLTDPNEVVEVLKNIDKHIAFDLDAQKICFSIDSQKEYQLNFRQNLIDDGFQPQDAVALFGSVMADSSILKILYDAKSIMHRLDKYNIRVEGEYFDPKLARYLIDMTLEYESLQSCLELYGICPKHGTAGMFELREQMILQLSSMNMTKLYYEIELPLAKILFDIETRGFKIDVSVLDWLSKKFTAELGTLTKQIYAAADCEFNINSPKQLGQVLFEKMALPYPKKSKAGYSTSAEILEEIFDSHPIIALILRYRLIFKLNSTYIEGLKKLLDSNNLVHTEFRQTFTTTGRLSSIEPNLQNIPVRESEGRELRRLFVPKADNVLVLADYSQIELRLLAHFSEDEKMLEAYQRGEDIHAATAAAVFNVGLDKVDSTMRRAAKAVNFGIIYGISDFGLAQNLGISRFSAKDYIQKYFETYPKIKAYMQNNVEFAKANGYAVTLFDRRRALPELKSPNYTIRSFGERAAMNMPLQGTAADLIKLAMVNVERALQNKRSKLILQVHDELIIDATADEAQEIAKILKYEMENAVKLRVPLVADVKVGKSWFEAKD